MNFILKKAVDESLLKRGLTIPAKAMPVLSAYLSGGALAHGERRQIKILLQGETYDATLTSVDFNRNKYPKRADMWQIVYSANSPIAKKLAEIFMRSRAANFKLPDSESEYFVLYPADARDLFRVETIGAVETFDEIFLENLLERPALTDAEAALIEKLSLTKIRRLHREIGDYLKAQYDFRCQICGQNVGILYGVNVAECHHIDYFVRSLNNDASNLLILCPNHHRIIHAAKPIFDRNEKIFRYADGSRESLALNDHL